MLLMIHRFDMIGRDRLGDLDRLRDLLRSTSGDRERDLSLKESFKNIL